MTADRMRGFLTSVCLVACATAMTARGFEYRPNPTIQNTETNIAYGAGKRCQLDVMWTKDKVSGLPVVIWFHGGGLVQGDKFFLPLTDHHIVQVAVRYPFLTEDGSVGIDDILTACAEAVDWTFKNIARYGGDPNRIFLSGHSAGGYITLMLGMDRRWLGRFGLDPVDLCGIVPLSGQATTHFNVRKYSGDTTSTYRPRIDDYAPLAHVDARDFPPMLVVCGDPGAGEWKCRAEENELLVSSIRACGHTNDLQFVRLDGMDHGAMRFPGYMYVQRFIRRYAPTSGRRLAPRTGKATSRSGERLGSKR